MACRLDPHNTIFFLCDIQEKFRKILPLFPRLIKNTDKLLNVARIFNIPVIVTEQYPEKLGNTVKELELCPDWKPISKTQFSMWVPEVEKSLKKLHSNLKSKNAVLFGVEAHACIENTVIDFLKNDLLVNVVADCVCSRLNQDRDIALKLMQSWGVNITTSEAVIFQLLADKKNPHFDDVRRFISDTSADMVLTPNKDPAIEKASSNCGK